MNAVNKYIQLILNIDPKYPEYVISSSQYHYNLQDTSVYVSLYLFLLSLSNLFSSGWRIQLPGHRRIVVGICKFGIISTESTMKEAATAATDSRFYRDL